MDRVRELMGRYMDRMDDEAVKGLVYEMYLELGVSFFDHQVHSRQAEISHLHPEELRDLYWALTKDIGESCRGGMCLSTWQVIERAAVSYTLGGVVPEKERPWWKVW
jgi:hypothetical protein